MSKTDSQEKSIQILLNFHLYLAVFTREWKSEVTRTRNSYTWRQRNNKFVKNWQDKRVWVEGVINGEELTRKGRAGVWPGTSGEPRMQIFVHRRLAPRGCRSFQASQKPCEHPLFQSSQVNPSLAYPSPLSNLGTSPRTPMLMAHKGAVCIHVLHINI